MGFAKKVFFNASAQFIGKIINSAIGLVSVAIVTRYLGVSGYGDYTTAFAYIMFFSVISDFGFFWVIVKKVSTGYKAEDVVGNAKSLRLVFAGIVIACALLLTKFLPYSTDVKKAIIMVAISILWMGQNSVYLALFQAKLRMDWAVLAETTAKLLSLGLMFLAIHLKLDFLWIIGASLATTFLNYIFNLILSTKYCRTGFSFDKKIMKEILLEALPIGIVTILSLIYFKIDTVLLSVLKQNIDVGIYGTAYKILEILSTLPAMFVGSVFPAISSAFSEKNFERLERLMQKSFDALSIASFGICGIFFGLAKPVINIIAGKEYTNVSTITLFGNAISADVVLQILIIAVALSFWSSLFTNSLITFNKQKELIKPYIWATIFNLTANILLIPLYSYLAAAIITVVTELIILFYTYRLVKKLSHLKIDFSVFAKSALAGLVMLLSIIITSNANFIISGTIAVLIFISVLMATGALSKETFLKLIKNEERN